mmetsp:Transcript_24315/g.61275  ORF Transcript_24315/g.61275 Transcript_24315/m.61275 type:complete len:160 (+) Transcript_24315:144-623(+)
MSAENESITTKGNHETELALNSREIKQLREMLGERETGEKLKPLERDRDELKREKEELEFKVMKLELELKNIRGIEERKYQVEIMRLKTENEELRRADKRMQMIQPKTPSTGGEEGGQEQAATTKQGTEPRSKTLTQQELTRALARVRMRSTWPGNAPQ